MTNESENIQLAKKAIILHGTGGSPEGNWFRWLEAELCKKGVNVWLPQLPSAEKPFLKDWITYALQNAPFDIDNKTILIGHSSGATLALALSAQLCVNSVVAVSPFVPMRDTYTATQWSANENLFFEIQTEEMLNHVKQNNTNRIVIFSDDDPYIPVYIFEHIIKTTVSTGILISGQGHFNTEKSKTYHEFPLILEQLIKRNLITE